MKVAYCLTGLIDNETITRQGLEELQAKQDIDFFCHTWEDDKNPGLDLINNFNFISTSTSTYEQFLDHVLSLPNAKTLYTKANSQKEINHFFRTHMAQFFSTIKCVDMANKHNDYDIIIKARSNIRFDKTVCSQFPASLQEQTKPILERQPNSWKHFQQINSDDRPNTIWDNWPECIDNIDLVFAPSFTFPIWQNQCAFLDTIFAMEKRFAEQHILHKDFFVNIINTFIYFAENTDTLAMEADKVWFKYLMDNNVAVFGFPLVSWMTREKKIII
tara:strand:+ start:7356 stop:8177 length:822 start_codon:yes stop_codon:yes gene_type:complete